MGDRKIYKLTDIRTSEVSLVKRGANKKRLAIKKAEDEMSIDLNVFEAVVGSPAEGEEKFVELMKSQGVDGDKLAAKVAQYRLAKGSSDLLSGDEVSDALEAAGVKARVEKSEVAVEKAEVIQKQEAVIKSQESKIALLEKSVEALSLKDEERELVAVAKSFEHLPQAEADTVAMLKVAKNAGEDNYKATLSMLEKTNEMHKGSALLKTVGGHAQPRPDSAAGTLQQVAKDLKGNTKLTKHEATIAALDSNPELYDQMMAEDKRLAGLHD